MSSSMPFWNKMQEILSRRGAQLERILSAKGKEAEASMSKAGDSIRKNAEKALENVKAEQQGRKEGDRKKSNDAAKKSQCPHGKKQSPKEPCKKCGERDEPVWQDYKGKWANKYQGGYVYSGSKEHSLSNYKGWDQLVRDGIKTEEEKRVLIAVAKNEGKMDSVQNYDRAVMTAGGMQWTILKGGRGLLADMISKFKDSDPDKYKELFADAGWTVDGEKDPVLSYKGKTGEELQDYLCQKGTPKHVREALGALNKAGKDPVFQRHQVLTFNDYLVKMLGKERPYKRYIRTKEGIKVLKKYNYPFGDYITSEHGTAVMLDQYVNSPTNLNCNFGDALNTFFENHPGLDQNPNNWPSDQRGSYEKEILDLYTPTRKMDKPVERLGRITNEKLSTLPGSFRLP